MGMARQRLPRVWGLILFLDKRKVANKRAEKLRKNEQKRVITALYRPNAQIRLPTSLFAAERSQGESPVLHADVHFSAVFSLGKRGLANVQRI
jgi:hypothetical protein